MRHQRRDVAQLSRFGFQKVPARRNAVEKIGDADGGADRQARRLHADELAAGKFDAGAVFLLGGPRLEQQARDRRDRRQRFPAKAQRGDRKQVIGGAQLRGGVPLEGQQRVVVCHAAAVVDHADHALAARFNLDAHGTCAGIERVLEQLLHHRGGPLDHLARGDAVGDCFRQYANPAHYSFFRSESPSNSSWSSSTGDGASAIKSCAAVVFGKAITSRRDFSPESSAQMRSMPRAMPPCGGVP